MVPLVEHLVRRGADVHVRGRNPAASALELAESLLSENPSDATARRIHEICAAV